MFDLMPCTDMRQSFAKVKARRIAASAISKVVQTGHRAYYVDMQSCRSSELLTGSALQIQGNALHKPPLELGGTPAEACKDEKHQAQTLCHSGGPPCDNGTQRASPFTRGKPRRRTRRH